MFSGASNISAPSEMFPVSQVYGLCCNRTNWVWVLHHHFLYFEQLWVSAVVSASTRQSSSDGEMCTPQCCEMGATDVLVFP